MTTVTATSSTRFVDSADGTAIAYDVTGTGPAVVVVEGALCQRGMGIAQALAPSDTRGPSCTTCHRSRSWPTRRDGHS